MQRSRPLFILVVFLFAFTEWSPAQSQRAVYKGKRAVEGEVLVKFRQVSPTSLAAMAQTYDLSSSRALGGVRRLYRLRSRSKKIAELLKNLSARLDVEYAEPNYELQAIQLPNDPLFVDQWALQNTGQSADGFSAGTAGADISAVSAWDISTGGTAHVVGIVDTGIDYTHPDLQANVWSAPTAFTIPLNGISVTCPAGTSGFNAILGTCDPRDDNMHGTHVAGIIGAAGNNNLGVVGINWTTQMMALKFLSAQGYGWTADAITAIEFAIQTKLFFASTSTPADVRILSNSWGGGGFSQALQDEVDRAAEFDMLFVAAAGNNSSNNDQSPMYPASFNRPNMIIVAATDNDDTLAYFSDFGPNSVQLAAPGVNILSTLPGADYGYLSGTSMATPYVSGAAALALSVCDLSTPNLIKAILDNVDAVPGLAGMTLSGGRLNVDHTLRSCRGPVGLSPVVLNLGSVAIGQSSGAKLVTLTNYQNTALNLSNVVVSPDYTQTSACGSALAPGASCTITVIFTPSASGAANGQLQVFDDAPNSPQTATLFGTGVLNIDLVASTSVSVTTTSPGSLISVNSIVANQGTASAGASVAGIYLSVLGLKDRNAVAAGSFNVPDLSGNSSFPAQSTVTIPSNLPLGSYYVVTCADDANLIVETSETNNCGATPSPIQVQALPLPDLIERSVTFTQVNPLTLQITDAVSNQGVANAAASITQYYLSVSGAKDASAMPIAGSRAIPALTPGASAQGTTTVAIPPSTTPGTYYLLACADDTNLVQESNESNNCGTASFKVAFLPDLTESGVTSQTASTGPGGTLTVTDTAQNAGAVGAAASLTQYYLSTLISKANGVLLGGSRSVPALAPGTNTTGTVSVTVPSTMPAGSFFLLACADDTNLVPESNENNNCAVAAARIQVGPDLAESAVSSQTTLTGPGATLTLTDTASNQGAGTAAASVTQYYLSPLISKANAVLLGGSRSVPTLAPSTTSTGTVSVTVPSTMQTGVFYLLACADDTNLVPETNENNNCAVAPTRIQVGPDLVESAVSSQTALTGPGAILTLTDTASNQGVGNAAASVTQYYLSPLISKANAVPLSGSRPVPVLAPSTSSTGTVSVTVPSTMQTGIFYLLACADDTNLVPETNENNNCAVGSTRIQVGPDLIESGVSSQSASTTRGAILTVSDTTTNQGAGTAAASVNQYYLSTLLSRSNGFLLGGSRSVPALAPSTSSSASVNMTIPSTMPTGSFFLLACADDTNLVAETNKNNNCAAFPQRIQVQ